MKKTAISLVLALALVLCVMLVAAPQAEATGLAHDGTVNHCVCGNKADGIGGHDCDALTAPTTWTELTITYITATLMEGKSTSELDTTDSTYVSHPTVDSQSKYPVINLPAGSYYLSADLELPYALRCNGAVTICLNGHNLKGNTAKTDGYGRVFVQQGKAGTLNLCDCTSNPGTVSASTNADSRVGGVILLSHSSAVYNIYGGTINAAPYAKQGGAINATSGAKINMYGGTIQGGNTAASGANIYLYNGQLNLHGGTIQNGTAGAIGGNILIHNSGNLTMTGGSILNGTAVTEGGNIRALGTVAITGGTIQGGADQVGAGIYADAAKLSITNCDITDSIYYSNTKQLKHNSSNPALKLDITKMGLEIDADGNVGVGYVTEFKATEAIKNALANSNDYGTKAYGLKLWLTQWDEATQAYVEVGTAAYLGYTAEEAATAFTAGATNTVRQYLAEIMKASETADTNSERAAYKVNGAAFICVNGTVVESAAQAFTLQTLVEKMDANLTDDASLAILKDLYALYKNVMSGWTLTKINAAA